MGLSGVADASTRMENEGMNHFWLRTKSLPGTERPAGNVFRHQEIELQPGQAEAADETRNQQRRQHGGRDQEQQVVGGDEGAQPDQQDGQREQQTAAVIL